LSLDHKRNQECKNEIEKVKAFFLQAPGESSTDFFYTILNEDCSVQGITSLNGYQQIKFHINFVDYKENGEKSQGEKSENFSLYGSIFLCFHSGIRFCLSNKFDSTTLKFMK